MPRFCLVNIAGVAEAWSGQARVVDHAPRALFFGPYPREAVGTKHLFK